MLNSVAKMLGNTSDNSDINGNKKKLMNRSFIRVPLCLKKELPLKDELYLVVIGDEISDHKAIVKSFANKQFPMVQTKNKHPLYTFEYRTLNKESLTLHICVLDMFDPDEDIPDQILSKANAFMLVYSVQCDSSWTHLTQYREKVRFYTKSVVCLFVWFCVSFSFGT